MTESTTTTNGGYQSFNLPILPHLSSTSPVTVGRERNTIITEKIQPEHDVVIRLHFK